VEFQEYAINLAIYVVINAVKANQPAIQEHIIKKESLELIFGVFKQSSKFIIISTIQLYRILLETNGCQTVTNYEEALKIIIKYFLVMNPKK